MALTKYNYNSFDITPVASKALAFNSDADGLTTVAGGSMVLIKTLTASSSATLSFVDGTSDVVLDNTYPIYDFKFINIHPATNAVTFGFNGSIDAGSNYNVTKTTTQFTAFIAEADEGASLEYSGGEDIAQGTGFQAFQQGDDLGGDNDQCHTGYLRIFNPSSTTFVKHFIAQAQYAHQGDYTANVFTAGYFNTTSAVDAMQFKMSSGNVDAGQIKLYGIKDS